MMVIVYALLILTSSCLPSVVSTQDCISSFVDLENSIISNNGNIRSLTKGFYPANMFPALWVEVKYYLNTTDENETTVFLTHPVEDGAVKRLHKEDYVFFWVSSPVLIYIHPRLLEGISLYFVTIEDHIVYLVIQEFCDNLTTAEILGMLNEATIWLKSYTAKRKSTLYDGIDPVLQGYTSYKPNIFNEDFYVFGREDIYQRYVYEMVVAILLIVIFCQITAPIYIWRTYNHLIRKSKQGLMHTDQRFRFKSIMWALVTALLILVIIILGFDLHHIITFGLMWNDRNEFLYYLLLPGLVLVVTMNFIIAIIITRRGYKRNELIELPNLFLFKKTVIVVFFQFLFVMTELLATLFLSFHSCGIILAVLVNPIQAFVTMVLSIMIVLFFLFSCTFIYEKGENIEKCSDYFEIILRIVLCIIFVTFLASFGNIYLNVILFAGTEHSGIVHSLAQIFPAILLTFMGWLVKKQYDNFLGKGVKSELST